MMIDIQKVDLVGMNNGAHYEFMKVVNDRFAAETTLSTNASAKKAMEALAAALKEEDRCLVISRRNLIMTTSARPTRRATTFSVRCVKRLMGSRMRLYPMWRKREKC